MRECTDCSLNEVMVGYDQAVAKREPTDEETAQQKFDQLRDEVIRPLMTAFGGVLDAHGHRWSVFGKAMSVTTPGNLTQYPEIIMYVVPKMDREPASARGDGYQISFMLAPEQRKILVRMTHGPSAEACSACPHDLHPMDGVTPELIEAELLEMMQHVFANARAASSVDIGRASRSAVTDAKLFYLASATRPPR